MLSERRWAVTVISSSTPAAASGLSLGGAVAEAADAVAEDTAPMIAATAYETVELICTPHTCASRRLERQLPRSSGIFGVLRAYSKTRAPAALLKVVRFGCSRRVEGESP